MARRNDTSNVVFVPAGTSLVGGYTSAPFSLLGAVGFSITTISAGTVSGTYKIQYSDFGAGDMFPQDAPPSNGWVDSTTAALTASASTQRIDQTANAKWARLVFTDSASSGATFSAALTVRKYGE